MAAPVMPSKYTTDKTIVDYSKMKIHRSSVYSSETPAQFAQCMAFIDGHAHSTRRVLDMAANVGGFTVQWAITHPRSRITAVEYKPVICDLLRENACSLLKVMAPAYRCSDFVNNITCCQGDGVDFLKGKYDMVYVDPPWWNGLIRNTQLELCGTPLTEVVRLALTVAPHVYAKVPVWYSHPMKTTATKEVAGDTKLDYLVLYFTRSRKRTKKKKSK